MTFCFLRSRPAPPGMVTGACRAALPLALAALGAACEGQPDDGTGGGGSTTTTTTTTTVAEPPCGLAEQLLADGRCQPPGLPLDMPCPPGEAPLEDGSCQVAGVPPSECGEGFEASESGGCRPVLPEQPCHPGSMAIPGEKACHKPYFCFDGTWGDIPKGDAPQFVDDSYPGDDSDGTQQKPWRTIQDGVNAAAEGAVVAITSGTYKENVVVTAPVGLWGRCPSEVSVESPDPTKAAITVQGPGVEIHGLGITGPGMGVQVDEMGSVVIVASWLHDTGDRAVLVQPASSVTVQGSLIERPGAVGVESRGGVVVIERTVIRDVQPGPDLLGISVMSWPQTGMPPVVSVRSSLIEDVYAAAVNAEYTALTLERVAIRRLAEGVPNNLPSLGVAAISSSLTMTQATVEGLRFGVVVSGSQATLTDVTLSDGAPPKPPNYAAGILVQSDPVNLDPAHLLLRESVVEGQSQYGLAVLEASADIESARFQGNVWGNGHDAAIEGQLAELTVRHSVLQDNRHAALRGKGSDVLLESSVARGVKQTTDGGACVTSFGFLDDVELPASLTVRSSLIEDCIGGGIMAQEVDVGVESSIIRDMKADPDGLFGDGISLLSLSPDRPAARIVGSKIEAVARAGISAFGHGIEVGFASVSCATFDLAGEAIAGVPFSFDKLGDNVCGCPDAAELCQVASPGLAPPDMH